MNYLFWSDICYKSVVKLSESLSLKVCKDKKKTFKTLKSF